MSRSTVAVRFTGNTADLQRAIGTVNGGLGRLTGTIGKVGGILGGAFVADKVLDFGTAAIGEAEEAQRVTRDTAAVLKSMGVEADDAADKVANLAEKQSLKTGTDDELIQSAQNVLLTFSAMADSVERGSDLFERSSSVAQDMAARLGGDVSSAAMQVGKALNDPIRGLTALRRSGIQFTAQQEEQIKAMVAAGDVAGAQSIMLGELERQFGGSAEAQATATDKAKVAWANLQEQLGEKLLPVVERVANWLTANLPGAMARAQAAFQAVKPHIDAVIKLVREHWPEIQQTISSVMESVRVVVAGVLSVVQTLWANFGDNILEFVRRVWPSIQQTISGALEVIRGVIKVVTSLIKGDWSGVWEGIKNIVHGAFNVIVGRIKGAMELARLALSIALEVISSTFRRAFNGIVSWMAGLPGAIGSAASSAWGALKRGLQAAVDWIIGQIDRMLGPIDEALGGLGKIKGFVGGGGISDDFIIRAARGRASGLPVSAGGTYVVGENGPELLHMGQAGTMTPHHRIGTSGGGGSTAVPVVIELDGQVLGRAMIRFDADHRARNGRSAFGGS